MHSENKIKESDKGINRKDKMVIGREEDSLWSYWKFFINPNSKSHLTMSL